MPFKKPKKKSVLIAAVVVGLLILCGISWYYFSSIKNRVTQEDIDGLRVEVQQLMSRQKYTEVESILNAYLNEHPSMSAEYKYEVYTFLAGNYINLKNFQAAYDWYKKAESVDPDGLRYGNALGIAQTAQALGNTQVAIEYYKKTIELARSDPNPVNDTYIPSYERIIAILEDPSLAPNLTPGSSQSVLDPNIPAEIREGAPF